MLTQERVKELFTYDPESGVLRWRVQMGTAREGDVAGTVSCIDNRNVYRVVTVCRERCYVHRVVFLYVHGYLPEEVDHEDGDGLNNRITNLRPVEHKMNARNCRLSAANKSGITGVFELRGENRWLANIMVEGKTRYLGRFLTKEEAALARKSAEAELGFHMNHGSDRSITGVS